VEFPPRFYCLVCGDFVREWAGTGRSKHEVLLPEIRLCEYSKCADLPCAFSCHAECIKAVDKINQTEFLAEGFKCDQITLQMRPQIIQAIKNSDSKTIDQKRKDLAKTHQIKQPTDRRKRRYQNSNSVCTICNEEIPLLQENHLLQHCTGLKSSPVSLDINKDLRSFSKRCLEIADERLKSAHGLQVTPTRTARPRFGSRDGESLTEVAPRRKRARLTRSTNSTHMSLRSSVRRDAL